MIKNNKILSTLVILIIYLISAAFGIFIYRILPTTLNIMLRFFIVDVIATTIIYIGSMICKNSSVYDPYWSILPMVMIPLFIYEMNSFNLYTIVVLSLVEVWGLRLTINWFIRFKGLNSQDWRYTDIQNKHPKLWFIISYFGIHIVPTLVVFMGMIPIFSYVDSFYSGIATLNGTWIISIVVSVLAIVIESIADIQMQNFKKDPNNAFKLNRKGLWKQSRHPNYFGEILFWFSMFLFAISVNQKVWALAFCPLIVFLLFACISIPLMEKRQAKTKVGFSEYKKSTNMLLPIFAKGEEK